ncbi:hypothetical protein PRUB_a3018 [Pseudoalteromonas rubra]|uniref:Uncharacterized protein n=1 Tax=Pseudoalteromonas rubra TaxID=43658 RepID=A0A8T0CEH5_9GAMM|nr:hypothetical protein PRUB_a3018 [Pseudoalteromonas rubra]
MLLDKGKFARHFAVSYLVMIEFLLLLGMIAKKTRNITQ